MDDGLGGAVALRDTVADTMGPWSLLVTCDCRGVAVWPWLPTGLLGPTPQLV